MSDYTPTAPPPFKEKRDRRWCFTDLFTDHQTGKMRETALWSNVGKFAALCAFAYRVSEGTDTEWLWAIVMGVLTAHELVSRWLSQKLGVQVTSTTTTAVQSETVTQEKK